MTKWYRGLRMAGLTLMAAWACMASAYAGVPVTQEDVVVTTSDGSAEAALFYPAAKGKWPAVVLWPDLVGLRPAFRDLARRFAAEGYVVLVPNVYYRGMRPGDAELNARDPATRATLTPLRDAALEGVARDAAAYVAFLDARKQVNRAKKVGVIGYDAGGAYAFLAAVALPERVGAVGTIYGAGVATARPTSPHLLVSKSRAAYYVALSQDDDAREPDDKGELRKVFGDAGLEGTVEVYPANHGWANPAGQAYDAPAAQRSFEALVRFLKATLG